MSTNDGNWKSACEITLAVILASATIWQGTLLHRANIDNRESAAIADRAANAASEAAIAAKSNAATAALLLGVQNKQLIENAKLADFTHVLATLQEKQIIALYRPIISIELAETGQSNTLLGISVKNIGSPLANKLKLNYHQPAARYNVEQEGTLIGPNELLQGSGYIFPVPLRLETWITYPVGGSVSITGSLTFQDAADNPRRQDFCFLISKKSFPSYPPILSKC